MTWLSPLRVLARFDAAVAIAVGLTAAVLAAMFTLWAGTLESVASGGFPYLVDNAPASARHLVVSGNFSFTGLDEATEFGTDLHGRFGPTVGSLIAAQRTEIESVTYGQSASMTGTGSFLRSLEFRVQPDVERQLRLVAGRWPKPRLSSVGVGLEIALTEAAAAEMEIPLEATQIFAQPRRLGRPLGPEIEVTLVGIFEPVDRADEYWGGDTTLVDPVVFLDGNWSKNVRAKALVAPDSFEFMATLGSPSYTWRYLVDPTRFDPATQHVLGIEFARIGEMSRVVGSQRNTPVIYSALPNLLAAFDRELATTRNLLLLAGTSIILVAVATAMVIARFIAARTEAAVNLARDRGASRGQVTLAMGVVIAMAAIPPSVAGGFLAAIASNTTPMWGALGLIGASLTTVLLGVMVWLTRSRRAGTAETVGRASGEILVIVLTVAALVSLQERGLDPSVGTIDPWLAATPALLGLSAAIILIRALPAVARLLFRSTSRGLVAPLVLRRLARRPETVALPVLVMLVALGVATYALVFDRSVAAAQEESAWQRAGADVVVDAPAGSNLIGAPDLATIDGVTGSSSAYLGEIRLGEVRQDATLLAVDAVELTAVTAESPVPVRLAFPSDTGGPIPAIVSPGTAQIGDVTTAFLRNKRIELLVVDVRPSFPTLSGRFVVAPLDSLVDRLPELTRLRNRVYVDLDDPNRGASVEAIRSAFDPTDPRSTITSLSGVHSRIAESPFSGAVPRGFISGTVVVLALAGLSVLLVMVLTSRARARDAVHLQLLGLPDRANSRMGVLEFVVPLTVAAALGVGVGLASAWLSLRTVDLSGLSGGLANVALSPEGWGLAIAPLAAVAVTLITVIGGMRRTDRNRVVSVVRAETQ